MMRLRIIKSLCLSIWLGLFCGCYAQTSENTLINDSNYIKPVVETSNNTEIKQDSQNKAKLNQTLKSYLKGYWKRENSEDCNFSIDFSSPTYLCMASNHVYGEVIYKLDSKKKEIYVYFKRTTSLSNAALTTPWKYIDKRRPIATIDVSKALSEGTIEVKWIGFLNKKTGEIYDYGKNDHEGIHRKQADDK